MTTRKYLVSADHQCERFACKDAQAVCNQDAGDGRWYASMAGYGCSKNYATPEQAIRGMLADHACTNVRIVEQPAAQSGYSLSEAELDQYVAVARLKLDAEGWRGIRVDRCRHATVSELALWLFDANDEQIGVVALLDPFADTYRANRMWGGMPTSERRFDSLRLALLHVVESR